MAGRLEYKQAAINNAFLVEVPLVAIVAREITTLSTAVCPTETTIGRRSHTAGTAWYICRTCKKGLQLNVASL
jgi:hypothetical protein